MLLKDKIIFDYNVLWGEFYFDAIETLQEWQITLAKHVPDTFCNAAHGSSTLDKETLKKIEDIFHHNNTTPSFFLKDTDKEQASTLLENNYKQINSESENWWLFDNAIFCKENIFFPQELYIQEVERTDEQLLLTFLDINSTTNDLTDETKKFIRKSIESPRNSARNKIYIGFYKNKPCACGTMGLLNNTAYLAEGGVLPEYRQLGIHSAMTHYRIEEATKLGAKETIMVSSQTSHSNKTANSLKFIKLGTRQYYKK